MLISIIMPVYNAEKTLNRALDSVLMQSFHDFELIAVNDGSNDSSLSLLEARASVDSRLRILSVENGGPANARNVGIRSARGEYVLFIDSDDEYIPGALTVIEKQLSGKEKGADMLIFGFFITDAELTIINTYSYVSRALRSEKELRGELSKLYVSNLLNQVWNKAYRADFLKSNSIVFQDYTYGEDRLFIFEVLSRTCKIGVIGDCLYYYKMNSETSLITKFYAKKFESCCLIDERIRALADSLGTIHSEECAIYDYMFIKSVISCLVQLYHPSCHLSTGEKRVYTKGILRHPYVLRKVKGTLVFGFEYRILTLIIQTRNVSLNMLTAHFIAFISQRGKNMFIKLKHKNSR